MQTDSYETIKLSAGELLFSAGELGAAAYLIASGCLEIFLEREQGDFIIAQRGAGEIIGEMALLDHRPRSASVRAAKDSILVVITEESVSRRVDLLDPILKMCLGVVLSRHRETLNLLGQAESRAADPPSLPDAAPFSLAIESLVLEREMKSALERSEFELFFQPIVRLADGALAGFETLMRWRHPTQGLIPPARFIPLAEASGFITALTDWAIAEIGRVMPDLKRLADARPHVLAGPFFVSVNISGHDLGRASLARRLTDVLGRAGIPPSCLKIEVTESVLMKNPESAAAMLQACRESGFGIAIDDFGTGYSSLSYLSTLPITTLKVDRAFVQAMLPDQKSRKIVQTILRLADELGIPVVAEGIERFAEAEMLNGMGCTLGQGFLFGRPAPLSATLDVVRGWVPTRPTPCRAIAC